MNKNTLKILLALVLIIPKSAFCSNDSSTIKLTLQATLSAAALTTGAYYLYKYFTGTKTKGKNKESVRTSNNTSNNNKKSNVNSDNNNNSNTIKDTLNDNTFKKDVTVIQGSNNKISHNPKDTPMAEESDDEDEDGDEAEVQSE